MRAKYSKRAANPWHAAGELNSPFNSFTKKLNRLMILSSVWNKETGKMAPYWELAAVKSGDVLVKVKSSAAAQELSMRSAQLARNLNKYFDKPWIIRIKTI